MEKERAALSAVDFSAEFAPQTYEQWKEEATASLKGAPFDKKLLTKTYEGITLQPLYTADMAADFAAKNGFPGAGDYLRGTGAAGYSGEPWLIAQEATGTPAQANAVISEHLAKGGTAICFEPCCLKQGNLENAKALLSGIDVAKYPFQVYCGTSAAPMLGLLQAYADSAGAPAAQISGVIGADPLAALAKKGANCGGMAAYYDQMASSIRWTDQHMPQVKTIFIQGAVYHQGGASAVQELAAVFATAVAYLDALSERGLSVDEIAAQMVFSFSLGANFFMEIAKLRAARMLWAQLVKAYGGNAEAAKLDARAATSHFTTTVYDPYVNILRATTQAFSGVMGGVSALTVEPFDAAVRESDEQSRRIARNIQVMMQNEFNLMSPVDPAGGSWYVETLTGQVAEAAWQQLQQIEGQGGMLKALQAGSIQEAIAATLNERFKKLATRADRAVGSNMYANMQETRLTNPACKCGCDCAKEQSCGCQSDNGAASIGIIGADDGTPYISMLAECFKHGVTVAQVKAALNKGEAETVTAIATHRWTEQFEALRIKTEEHAAKTGKNIEVFLANMGPIPQHKARADFSAGFMEVGGFTVLRNNGFATVEEAAAAAIASNATATVICSTDDTYPEIVPELARAIKATKPKMLVILAGAPAPEYKDSYVEAGVDEFIHIKANCLQILEKIQTAGGIE